MEGERRDPATGFLSRGRPLKKNGNARHTRISDETETTFKIFPEINQGVIQLSPSGYYTKFKPVRPSCPQFGAISLCSDAGMSNKVTSTFQPVNSYDVKYRTRVQM